MDSAPAPSAHERGPVAARERPAGFVLMETGTRPATPRAPFMPSPRKRARGTPQKVTRVPLGESTLNAREDEARGGKGEEEARVREVRIASQHDIAPRRADTPDELEDAPLHNAHRRDPFTRPTTSMSRAREDDRGLARGDTRPAGPRPATAMARTAMARPATSMSARRDARAPERTASPVRAPERTASPVRPVPDRTASPVRQVPERTASPMRAAERTAPVRPPARAASPTRPMQGSQTRVLRAKITDGVVRPRLKRDDAPGPSRAPANAPIRAPTPQSVASRAPTSLGTATGRTPALAPVASRAPTSLGQASPVRSAPVRTIPRTPSPLKAMRPMPVAAERVDVDAIADELGESSFLLDDAEESGPDSVQVHIRLRPTEADEECAWLATPTSATVMLDPCIAATKLQPNVGLPFQFDGLHTGSSNADVYAMLARPLVQSVLRGYNAVIFAYGQTASGKTFTLSGGEGGGEPGIIPRAICDVFQGICQGSSEREYLVRVSYLEIWNEIVKDLLDPTSQPQVRDDRRRGANAVFVAPLQEEVVTSPSQVFALLERGEANRHVGATDWNERSSRSHTCFKITVESWERSQGGAADHVGRHYRISELSLIDLAGSERHTWGARGRSEGANINKSLLSLGKVIYALSERSAAEKSERSRTTAIHVPFRDSKLTRILQNSLNGNARIAVVCTLNPSPAMVEESLGTLNFAKRIKKVAVRAEPNEIDGDLSLLVGAPSAETHALLVRYRAEMGALRAKVAQLQQAPAPSSTPPRRAASPATATATATATAPTPASIEALQERLDELGTLILRGGDGPRPSEPHPVSPAKQRGFAFDDPLPIVQEKLHAALSKISRLERKLATRLSMPGVPGDADKDARIEALQRQVRELETVLAAQTPAAPDALRDEVQAEFQQELDAAAERIAERDAFLAEVTAECARLRRANEQLVRLAHQDTEKMVASLTARPERPVMSLFAPHLRPATVLGRAPLGMPASVPSTPNKAWDAPISIDGTESETLSSSDLDEVLE